MIKKQRKQRRVRTKRHCFRVERQLEREFHFQEPPITCGVTSLCSYLGCEFIFTLPMSLLIL